MLQTYTGCYSIMQLSYVKNKLKALQREIDLLVIHAAMYGYRL